MCVCVQQWFTLYLIHIGFNLSPIGHVGWQHVAGALGALGWATGQPTPFAPQNWHPPPTKCLFLLKFKLVPRWCNMALGQGLGPKTCGGPKHGPWCPLGWLGRPSPPTGQWHPPSNTLHPPPCFFFMVLGGCLGVQVVHPHGGPHHAPHVATCNPPHTLPTLGGHGGAQGTEIHQPPPTHTQ